MANVSIHYIIYNKERHQDGKYPILTSARLRDFEAYLINKYGKQDGAKVGDFVSVSNGQCCNVAAGTLTTTLDVF